MRIIKNYIFASLIIFAAFFIFLQISSRYVITRADDCQECDPTPTPTPTAVPTPTTAPVGGAGGGPSTNTTGTPSCTTAKPYPAPDLFQINTAGETVTLFFTPNNGNATYYMVSFGFWPGDDRFGGIYEVKGSNTGVQSVTVGNLAPNTKYFFRVRAGDGCMPGDWSGEMMAITDGRIYYKYN